MSFRPFLSSDMEFYLACYKDAWYFAHGNSRGFNRHFCAESARFRLNSFPDSLRIAQQHNQDVGVLALDVQRDEQARFGWIVLIYLSPPFRGQGLGKALIQAAEKYYAALGRTALRLTVAPENPSVGFYSHIGFSKAGVCAGAFENLWIMEKSV